jgi:hypothetical protein
MPQRIDESPARPRRPGNAKRAPNNVAIAPAAPLDAEPPPLPPVQAPCTRNVAALGLCSPQVP